MKLTTIAGAALAVLMSCEAASAKTLPVRLQYKSPQEILDSMKTAGKSKLLEAVIGVDEKENAILMNDASGSAAELLKQIKALDAKSELIKLSATIKVGGQLLSRPLVTTAVGKPCLISIGEGKDKIEIEILPETVK